MKDTETRWTTTGNRVLRCARGGWRVGEEDFPSYPLNNGVPGKLPMMDFPEVSMVGGGRPAPEWFDRIWSLIGKKVVGGFPYSEGMRTDLNNVLCLGFYWNDRPARETIKEYCSFEYSPDVAEDATQIIYDLAAVQSKPVDQAAYLFNVGAVHDRLDKVESRLTPRARDAWRWKLQYFYLAIFYESVHSPRAAPLPGKMPAEIRDGQYGSRRLRTSSYPQEMKATSSDTDRREHQHR